ncbi:helix-turn-helix domain-containing protein [Deefgea tanakiae]|jgi:transcriptional regulator with XRE-family HTH domain|uniref:Helix-turn-helix domain-containing protein n=1 Tax=Deefgea tanakiae TaxID=2865840 RepID=A0ABX8Z712_9NEIS|nr:helix-turn-helix transcriptional regulator [Deefgea tanakiae]QZA77585.1 helix-turn-helix domain-containing protein [Deefgea tanakiae]
MSDQLITPKAIRKQLGMNQHEFWSKIGVTQSGGSRYESGRNMPKPVQELLRVVHIEGIDLSQIRKDDIRALEYLKSNHPNLFERIYDEAHSAV